MTHDQDTVLFDLTINEQGDPKLRLVDQPPEQVEEWVFTMLSEEQTDEVMRWLQTTGTITPDDLRRIMAAARLLPDTWTIRFCDQLPSPMPKKPETSSPD
jgi:hypothetical protein